MNSDVGMFDELIPVYRTDKKLPHELDDDVLVIRIMRYIVDSNITSDLDFLNMLLSDLRCNVHNDWYDRYFVDLEFREFLTDCFVCQKYNKLLLFLSDRLSQKAWDGTWNQIYGTY